MRWRIYLLVALCAAFFILPSRLEPSPAVQADQSEEQPYPISTAWPAGVQAFLRLETSALIFNLLYRYGRVTAAPNGAYGPNVTAPRSAWFLEYQRTGNTDVIAGVLHRDSGMIEEGLRIFHFGLAREAGNGSFPGSTWPFHGTAMFLADAAPALLALEFSPLHDQFAAELRWQTARLRKAARYMVRSVGGPGRIDDRTKNHRFFEAAMALGATGVLSGDATLRRWSERYAWIGVRMERSNGVMPEDGGHDTGYQALGMVHATRYLELLAAGQLSSALRDGLQRGEAWELSRVRPDGSINQSADTRTVGCRERDPEGRCKTTSYLPIFSALARWSVLTHDSRYERAAYRVWLQNWRLVPGDVLPKPGMWVKPREARHGDWLTVWATGFQPLEPVRVYFGDTLIKSFTSDQIGSFGGHSPVGNVYFALPDVGPGTYTIKAVGSFGTTKHTRVTVVA